MPGPKLTVLLLCSLVSQYLQAQFTVGVTVLDSLHHPIEFVTVSLFKDTALVKTALSDKQGRVQFSHTMAGSYRISSSHINYLPQDTLLTVSKHVELKFVLAAQDKSLTAVAVTARKPLIERKTDRFVVNVAKRIAGAANAWDVLGKSPMISVKEPSTIALAGSGVMVQLNGRILKMPAEAQAAYLKGISAESVDKIEILTTPSSEYDADTRGGIINIILKKPVSDGWLGGVQLSTTQLTYNNQSFSANAEYQQKKLTLYGFVNASNAHFLSWQKLYNDYSFERPNPTVSNQEIHVDREAKEKALSGNLGMDYAFNRNSQLGFVVDYSVRDMDRTTIAPTWFLSPASGAIDSINRSTGGNSELAKYVNADLLYKIRLDSTGQSLKFQTSGYRFKEHRDGQLNTLFKQAEGTGELFRSRFRNMLPLSIWNYTANVDYIYPWQRGRFQLDMGLKYGSTRNSGDISFDNWNGSGYEPDIQESQAFLYREHIYAAYGSFVHKVSGRLHYKLGLRLEQTRTLNRNDAASTENRYTNLFPNAFVFYSLHADHQLSYAFTSQLQRPSFFDVNPFKIYSTDRLYLTGDPFLQPSRRYRNEITYTLQNRHIFQLIYSDTRNRISTQTIVDPEGKLHVQKGNFSNSRVVSFVSSLNPEFFPCLTTSFDLYAGLVQYKGSVAGFPINQQTAYVTASMNTAATIKPLWSLVAGVDVFEVAPFYSDNTYVKNQVIVNGFLSKRLGQSWRFTFAVNDVFHTAFDRTSTLFEQTELRERYYHETSRGVRFSIAYNFQHKVKNSNINEKASNSEEKRRVGK
ncbi:outer membrane beta-barrel protein [Paraflavitalea pollutisoli]|uniref:outer membrane beta-barrel protein n=1 Tax=Paraflavitalea pollutisoli TaxID=3034143 RepID=UPI0023EB0A81|nr:outer membrane beta-barrel protein [Paraflavitalea sp. H1-2-19X]